MYTMAIIRHNLALTISVLGLVKIFFALFMIVCGFTLLGSFCGDETCGGIARGIGLWIGFPLLIPGILALIVFGTRHPSGLIPYFFTNIILMVLCIVQTVMAYIDYNNYWKFQTEQYHAGNCQIFDKVKCQCGNLVYPYLCDLVEVGNDMNWVIFGLSIVGIILSFVSAVVALVARVAFRNTSAEDYVVKEVQ